MMEVGKAAYERYVCDTCILDVPVVTQGVIVLFRYRAPRDPNLVSVVSATHLAPVPIMDREGCAVLYGPKPASFRTNKDDKNDIYDIVVHTEKHKSQSLSIFRTGSEPEARCA